jgi:hypothetical protein
VLDLVEAGRSVADVARDLEISGQSIYTWQRQDRIDRGLVAGLSSTEKAELGAAKRRIAELETELRAMRAIGTTKIIPVEVVTDHAPVYPGVLEELAPAAWHRTDQYANNRIEADHGRLKARLGPMRGLEQDRSARIVIAGHAFVQNLRRGCYELAIEGPASWGVAVAFDELALAI